MKGLLIIILCKRRKNWLVVNTLKDMKALCPHNDGDYAEDRSCSMMCFMNGPSVVKNCGRRQRATL